MSGCQTPSFAAGVGADAGALAGVEVEARPRSWSVGAGTCDDGGGGGGGDDVLRSWRKPIMMAIIASTEAITPKMMVPVKSGLGSSEESKAVDVLLLKAATLG